MLKIKKEKTRNFQSLTVTLAVAFLVLSAAILLVIGSLNMYNDFQNQRAALSDHQQLIAKEATNTVRSFVQEKFSVLNTAASLSGLLSIRQEEQKVVLEKLLGLEPAFRQLVLLNAQEQVLVRVSRLSTAFLDKLIARIPGDMFSKLVQTKKYISDVYIDEVTSEPMMIMAVSTRDVFGDFKGILMAEVNLKFMWDLLDRMRVGRNGLAYVVNRQGNLIAFGDISRVLKGESLVHLDEVNRFLKYKDISPINKTNISKGIQGTYVVASHENLYLPDWAVVVELPVLEAYKNVIGALGVSGLIMLFSFILAIVVGINLSKRITKPIISLREAAIRIGEGDLDTRIKIETKNEIEDLAKAFNQMVQDLQQSTTSIDNLNREIVERKKAEERLKAAYIKLKEMQDLVIQAEKLNAVGRLASGIAHEVKNPLGIILQGVNYLEKKISPKQKDVFETLTMLEDSVGRANKIVTSLLDFSKIKEMDLQPRDINAILEDSLNLVKQRLSFEHIEIVKETKKDIPKVLVDKNKMEQVFINVFLNAIQAIPGGGGKITIRSYDTRLKEVKNGIGRRKGDHFVPGEKAVVVEVEDTGTGISEENLKKIFDPFFTTKSPGGGSGLGLYVTRSIIYMHKGLIDVKSQINKGTKVTIIFKISREG